MEQPHKTIGFLNAKWWYRFLKIVYIFAFLFCLIAPIVGIIVTHEREINDDTSYIACVDGRKIDSKASGHLFSTYDFRYGLSVYEYGGSDDNKAKLMCLSDEALVSQVRFLYSDEYKDVSTSTLITKLRAQLVNPFSDISSKLFVPKNANYNLVAVYDSRPWLKIIGLSLLSLLATVFIFELLKRLFYYITLGRLFPKKS